MRSTVAFVLLAMVLLAGGPALAEEMTTKRALEVVDLVSGSVAEIRGLPFEREVSVRVIDDAAATAYVRGRIFEFHTPEEIEADQRAFAILGLLEPGTDIVASYLEVMEEQAGGYYDPDSGVFFLLDDMPASVAPVLVAHELTHALEDQHFDLDARIRGAVDNDDRLFALSAVHEGSASLLMTRYSMDAMQNGTLELDDMLALQETEAAKADRLTAMPVFLSRQLVAPYAIGMGFLLRGEIMRLAAPEFPVGDVDRAFRSGPLSSEQILHPEKYWDPDKRDDPIAVEISGVRSILGKGWKNTASGVLGELGIGVLVGIRKLPGMAGMSAVTPGEWTNAEADGWGGDRWELWERRGSSVVVLRTVWDTAADAQEFLDAGSTQHDRGKWRMRDRDVVWVVGDAGASQVDRLIDALLPAADVPPEAVELEDAP